MSRFDPDRSTAPAQSRRAPKRLATLAAIAAIACTTIVGPLAAPGQTTSTGSNGRIAWKGFLHPDFSTSAVFSAEPGGTDVRQLSFPADGVTDDRPDWSPDGSSILFERDMPDTDVIYRINADGSGLTAISGCTGLPGCLGNDNPSYSPDGARIAFLKVFGPILADPDRAAEVGVWVMNADGSHASQLTQALVPTTSEDHEPKWSPDGTRIVFTRLNTLASPQDMQALFVMDSDGSRVRQLTPWGLNAGAADWSPNGRLIVFQSCREGCPGRVSQILTIYPDGTHLMKLTTQGRNIEPAWSPDGRKIVFGHQPGVGPNGFADLYEMNADGTGAVPIIQTDLWESEPDWGTHP